MRGEHKEIHIGEGVTCTGPYKISIKSEGRELNITRTGKMLNVKTMKPMPVDQRNFYIELFDETYTRITLTSSQMWMLRNWLNLQQADDMDAFDATIK